jgi:hypothetical protein
MVVNCGKGSRSCERATVVPVRLVVPSRPAIGLVMDAVLKLITAVSRIGLRERYCAGSVLMLVGTTMLAPRVPEYATSTTQRPGSSRWMPACQRWTVPVWRSSGVIEMLWPRKVERPPADPVGAVTPFGKGFARLAANVRPLFSVGTMLVVCE